jgi:hypothetical protein
MISPPLGCNTWPVMYCESADAKNRKQVAHSHGSPTRPSGVSLPNFLTLSAGNVAGMSGVQMGPGATAFTRIPSLASEPDSDRVAFWFDDLAGEIASAQGAGPFSWTCPISWNYWP